MAAACIMRGTKHMASLHIPGARGWHLNACALSTKAKGGPRKKAKRKYGLATKRTQIHDKALRAVSAARLDTGASTADAAGNSKLSSFNSWFNSGPGCVLVQLVVATSSLWRQRGRGVGILCLH